MAAICDWEFGMTASKYWRESQEWSIRTNKSRISGPGGWRLEKCGQNLKIIKKSPLMGRFNAMTWDHCTTQQIHGRFATNLHEPRALRQERHGKEPLNFGACVTDAQMSLHDHWRLEKEHPYALQSLSLSSATTGSVRLTVCISVACLTPPFSPIKHKQQT